MIGAVVLSASLTAADPTPSDSPSPSPMPTVTVTETPATPSSVVIDAGQFSLLEGGLIVLVFLLAALLASQLRSR